jgi:hypothetical protein
MTATDLAVVKRINSIRTSFGLAPGQETNTYTSLVLRGIRENADPAFSPLTTTITEEDSVWGAVPGPTPSLTAAMTVVDAWVYHDGWCGTKTATWNAECTAPKAAGCDGHRRSILSRPPSTKSNLYIDVIVARGTYAGATATEVAALLVWKVHPQPSLLRSVPQTSLSK